MSKPPHYQLYLDGRWVDFERRLDVTDPATGATVGTVACLERADVARAIDSGQRAWASWRRCTARDRADLLLGAAGEVERRGDEIARVITLENGKPLAQSRGEVAMTIDHLRWFAEEGRRAYGRIVPPQADGKRHLVIKVPIGVVGAIAPWNFPLVLAVRKVAPALAAGCPVILKPASATPICCVLFARCLEAAGVPAGVFQLVVGRSAEIGAEMLANPACRKISFTGSTEVGRKLIAGSAETVTSISMELGGHGPVLVFDDADLDTAVQGAMGAKFRNTGQSCIAANRIYVQRAMLDRFVEAFVQRARALKVGSGLEPDVDIGAMIDEPSLKAALRQIDDARDRGARVLCGGRRLDGTGTFLEATVLVDVPDDALCMREETFAPVAPIQAFDTEAEAVARANDTRYGLSAYVFTTDLARTLRLAESVEAGMIAVNDDVPTTSQCPFGGMKESGIGRELGSEGLDAYLETKHVSIAGVN